MTKMTTDSRQARKTVVRRASAALGGVAVITAFALSMSPQRVGFTTVLDAHQKFVVVTVIARPSATPRATVTETDKPHQLQTPRATPDVRAPRTVMAAKP